MAQPSLKIKLRLTPSSQAGDSSSPAATPPPTASPTLSVAGKHALQDTPSPNKRSKTNSRNRKPNAPKSANDTTAQVDDHHGIANSDGDSSRNDKSNVVRTSSAKDILKYKDMKARHWIQTPLVFKTLDGSEIRLTSWQSDETMKLNKRAKEPMTVAEIDQLFSSAGGEKDFRPFLCTQPGCSKSFTSYDQLQTHETNMHGTKKLVCGIDGCHKSFVTSGQLTKHRKMVHFRAARKAKLAAAASANDNESNDLPNTNASVATADDEGSVDIGISEDNA
ncbi:uncharacterized protein BYT42DRAFT_584788 [Radiomyces spectabilis]|uniref:uncharacterized protein n=1 Tax=Radiomyces spectabilis TaxID=64574 RepID=UPI00221FED45|nr:uncharacterized protein BYT42DRAFT_584788 [Radiomyces spectabilis]KAI8369534.1 hypothetical protein BYT42DRAFT_584788 [Radiomyces spectabilis]